MRINLAIKRGDSLSLSFNCFNLRSQPQVITGCSALLELIPTDEVREWLIKRNPVPESIPEPNLIVE